MARGRKRGGSCWTCRLRRKRCNLVRPVCGSCQDLEITCYSDEAKPWWMDGGIEENTMSEEIKRRIKESAFLRREKRRLTHGNLGLVVTNELDQDSTPTLALSGTSHSSEPILGHLFSTDSTTLTLSTSSDGPASSQLSDRPFEESRSPLTPALLIPAPATLSIRPFSNSPWSAGPAIPIQVELGSVMIYLDYVFPFLFPFYQPSLIETGRQWLLGLLCQNEVSFHIAASLSAYFFSLVAQSDEQGSHDDCKALVLNRLVEQIDMAVKSIQSTVSFVSRHGAQSPLLDKVRTMQEIVQLLIVEVTVRRNAEWRIHLTPALVLFDEMFKSCGIDYSGPSMNTLLNALPSMSPMPSSHHKALPYTADQSSSIFFVSLLLFIDIIASTSLDTPPALQSYHNSLLSFDNEGCRLRLETIIGCRNWVLVAIGSISAFCSWKRDARSKGTFSVVTLVNLAKPISQALEEGLTSLDTSTTPLQAGKTSVNRIEGYYSRHDRAIDSISIANINRIWAHAAKIYLFVTLSGWQTHSPEIQASVFEVLSLSQAIESPAQLRSLSWPIAVAGCLALPSQEDDFRRIVATMGELIEFGTVLDAARIMEAVWISRDTIDGDTWDIASSLSILGSPVLLL